ncbi:MAG: 4-(cytidine 5'-diphospho)-2-C-methyl-D-erythritol kinase [Bacteroidota bacterium]
MIVFPNAKINIGLKVVGKRQDGYHDIETCFYPIPWNDVLEIVPSEKLEFHCYGLEIPGNENENLCLKAYDLLAKDFSIPPVSIHLLKNIPMGGGLGGGSSNGAFTLSLLSDLFDLKLTTSQKIAYALLLGSDCPFFIQNQPVIATGRGELLEPVALSLAGQYLAIYNPGIHISTKEAFSKIQPQGSSRSIKSALENQNTWKTQLKNDFETSAFAIYPEIKRIKDEMIEAGAYYSSMTGTGSTVYGLFSKKIVHDKWKILSL